MYFKNSYLLHIQDQRLSDFNEFTDSESTSSLTLYISIKISIWIMNEKHVSQSWP